MIYYNIVLAVVCVICFMLCVASYLLGAKHGRDIQRGNMPTLKIKQLKTNPASKEEELKEELEDILSATKEGMLKSIERGRLGEKQ